jgi:hypothetical protein
LGKDKEKSTRSDAPGAEKQQERKEDLSNRAQQRKGNRKMASVLLLLSKLLFFQNRNLYTVFSEGVFWFFDFIALCEDTAAPVPLSIT